MLIHDMYLEAVTRELEANEKAPLPTVMYIEAEEFEKFKDELHVKVNSKKVKISFKQKQFTINMCGTIIEFRSEEWEDKTVH